MVFLGCHEIGEVAEPAGDVSRTYCPDPRQRGKWRVITRTQGAAGEVTFDVAFPLGKTADWLERVARRRWPIPFYVMYFESGERNNENEYDRGFVMHWAQVTAKPRSGVSFRGADGSAPTEVTRTFSFSALKLEDYFSLVRTRRTTAAVRNILDIVMDKTLQAPGSGGPARDIGEIGFKVDASAVAAASTIYRTVDGGVTWTATAASPFAVAEDISSIVRFAMTSQIYRLVVVRGTTDAGNPAEIAYSDDNGTTWTLVNVGATNDEFAPWNGGLFAIDRRNLFLVTDTGAGAAGNIYKSTDGGVTWAAVYTGATDALNCIRFANEDIGLAVGDTNEILYTEDGGIHWDIITGPAAQAAVDVLSCVVLDSKRWILSYEDGEMWYTLDGGDNWLQRAIPLPVGATAITNIRDLSVVDEHCIWACGTATVGGNPFGMVLRTIDGGENWQSWLAPATGAVYGLGALDAISYNAAMAVGSVSAATGLVLEVAEVE